MEPREYERGSVYGYMYISVAEKDHPLPPTTKSKFNHVQAVRQRTVSNFSILFGHRTIYRTHCPTN